VVFSSIVFIFYFLPIFLAAYRFLPCKQAVLVFFSLLFYAYGEVVYAGVMIGSVLANHRFALWIDAREGVARTRTVAIGVAANLAALAWFKYAGFLYSIAQHLVGADASLHLFAGPAPQVHLPLGISFFTFHAISYLVDVYRRDTPPERRLIDVATYITMFPQLIAGPIVRFHEIRAEIHERHAVAAGFARGAQLFVIGLAQKVLIANVVAVPANAAFAIDPAQLGAADAWFGALCYTLQIYFDFCGYSTMAIGLALMLGFHFPQNFNHPYISQSITEFWRRWHMSLSAWFRDYLYVPLGGNRRGAWITCRNLLIVFLLCGLWHGANWTFVVWGLWHGLFLALERVGLARMLARTPRLLRHAYALAVVVSGWVIFRADTLAQARAYFAAMLGAHAPNSAFDSRASTEVVFVIAIAVVASTPFAGRVMRSIAGIAKVGTQAAANPRAALLQNAWLCSLLAVFVLATTKLATGAYNPFIYFRF
jgi:alginate O-acetyltransferase complex protein AlgI